MPNVTGVDARASSAVAANFRFASLSLTMKSSVGSLSVETPDTVVVAIPIAFSDPVPEY